MVHIMDLHNTLLKTLTEVTKYEFHPKRGERLERGRGELRQLSWLRKRETSFFFTQFHPRGTLYGFKVSQIVLLHQ